MNFKSRVIAGAEWLDEVDPGWEHKIDLDQLDLIHECRCVLGQIVKKVEPSLTFFSAVEGWFEDKREFGPGIDKYILSKEEAVDLGFHFNAEEDCDENFNDLTDLWRELIQKKLEK